MLHREFSIGDRVICDLGPSMEPPFGEVVGVSWMMRDMFYIYIILLDDPLPIDGFGLVKAITCPGQCMEDQ